MSTQRPAGSVIYDKAAWAAYRYALYALNDSGTVGFFVNWEQMKKPDLGLTHLYGRELLMFRPHSLNKKKFKNRRKKGLTRIK